MLKSFGVFNEGHSMRGEILTYSDADGRGLVSGDDGVRYSFARADLSQLKPIKAGDRVDFRAEGTDAREIFLVDTRTSAAMPNLATPMKVTHGHPSTRHHVGMWGYFKKCMAMYFNGNGRATRGEYWSFVLFYAIAILVPIILWLVIDAESLVENDEPSAAGAVLMIVAVIAYIALLIPSITVTIRRLHDLGLSGWLYLLSLVPYVGGLVIFVMMLIPGQKAPNVHGPDPQAPPLDDVFA